MASLQRPVVAPSAGACREQAAPLRACRGPVPFKSNVRRSFAAFAAPAAKDAPAAAQPAQPKQQKQKQVSNLYNDNKHNNVFAQFSWLCNIPPASGAGLSARPHAKHPARKAFQPPHLPGAHTGCATPQLHPLPLTYTPRWSIPQPCPCSSKPSPFPPGHRLHSMWVRPILHAPTPRRPHVSTTCRVAVVAAARPLRPR